MRETLFLVDSAMKRRNSEWTRTEKQLVVLVIVSFIVVLLLAVLLVLNFFVLREKKVCNDFVEIEGHPGSFPFQKDPNFYPFRNVAIK